MVNTGLIDRIKTILDGTTDIPNHAFASAVTLWALGEITKQNIIDKWSLDATGETELQEYADNYTSEPNANSKQNNIHRIRATGELYEDGLINKTKYKSVLGLT